VNLARRPLEKLLRDLGPWTAIIQRSAYMDSVAFSLSNWGLEAHASCKGRTFLVVLTNEELLGHTMALPAASWKVPKAACYWARKILQSLLNQRGV